MTRNAYRDEKNDFAIESKNSDYKITIAETIGPRPHQQDAIFVGEVENDLAKKNPAEFYRTNLPAIIDDHKECEHGSTLSSAITNQNADGTIDITTANLGDSRVAVVLKYKNKKNGEFGYRSILLTEDHKPNLKRVKDHILKNGGEISDDGRVGSGKLGNGVNIGATIGDNSVNESVGGKNCLLRTPDIWNFNSKDFLQSEETLEDLDLIVSCDGLWERSHRKNRTMSTDAEFVLEDNKLKLKQNTERNTSNLTKLRKEFDDLADKSTYKNSFAYYLQQKALEGGSIDNISASNITLVSKGKTQIPKNKSVMLTVCDGHGGEPNKKYEGNKENLAESELVKVAKDGALVAASVAARLANAAKIKEIKGLEIQQQKQESLFLFNQQYPKKPIIKTANHQTLVDLIVVKSTTHAIKKNNTAPLPDEDEGHTTDEGESDDETEVISIYQKNIIKARNKTTYAYTDREIEAVNRARNIQEGISYFKNRKKEESGILFKNNKPLNGSDGVKTIIEMPACALDQGSPIGFYLEAQLEHFKEFAKGKNDSDVYPVKILFPYKLQAWHWNVGEITLNKTGENFSLEGCAYDSMNKEASLEEEIQREISQTFEQSFRGKNFSSNKLDKKSNSPQAPQKGGIACGLYAARAMHNLKTKAANEVWEGALKDELTLRNEDSELVATRNPKSNFCLDERGFVDIFETKTTRKLSPTNEAKSKPEPINTTRQQILNLPKSATKEQLEEGAALLQAFAVEEVSGKKPDSEELFNQLNGNPLRKIVFDEEDSKKIKPTEQISNLALEVVLIASEKTDESPSTDQQKEYQECIELISGSYANYVRDWAISCPSISEAFERLNQRTGSVFKPTKEEENLNHTTMEIVEYISKKNSLSEEDKKDLNAIAVSASIMTCAEVESARKSSTKEIQEGVESMMKDVQANDYETKIVSLIEKFAKSDNPIFEKDDKPITALEVAKEEFAKAKKELSKKLSEKKIELEKEQSELEGKSSKDKKEQSRLAAIKLILEKKPEPTSEQKSTYNEKEIIEYSAKSILSKALKVSIIEERAKTEEGKKENTISTIDSPNLYQRYARKNFIGDENDKIKFENEKFEGNSFANCTFENCDFSATDNKTMHFVNCTFGEGCVLPQKLKNQNNNFLGCKFSDKIFDGITDTKSKDDLKESLGIDSSKVINGDFFEVEKPNSSTIPSTAFKLNQKVFTRTTL